MGKDLKGKELGVGILQRKDGIYQARFNDRWGKRKTIYNKSIKELRKELSIAVSENETFSSIREEIILDLWFIRWMKIYKEKSIRPNTKREYTHIYQKNISPHIGNRNINSLVKSDIQLLVDRAYDDGYQYERQNKIKVILRDMLQRAVEDNLLVHNPVSGIKLRSTKKVKAEALTLKEQQLFFDYCRNTFYDNLFNVAVNTGLRPGELFALTLEDIDFKNGFINVTKLLFIKNILMMNVRHFILNNQKQNRVTEKYQLILFVGNILKNNLLKKKLSHIKDQKSKMIICLLQSLILP